MRARTRESEKERERTSERASEMGGCVKRKGEREREMGKKQRWVRGRKNLTAWEYSIDHKFEATFGERVAGYFHSDLIVAVITVEPIVVYLV